MLRGGDTVGAMETIPDEAARARVKGLDGTEVTLQELWAGRPVVLAFVRHFG